MSADARLNTGFPGHTKTKKIKRKLGEPGCWSIVCLWLWAAHHRPSGDLSGLPDDEIESAADWNGDEGVFVSAMVSARYLDGDSGGYQIHDWQEHQPWLVGSDMRSLKARWNAVKRHHGKKEADRQVPEYAEIRSATSNAASNATSTENDATSNATDTAQQCSVSSPSPYPRSKAEKHSSTASQSTEGGEQLKLSEKPADLNEHKANRLAQVTTDAITAFNSILGKPHGVLPAVHRSVGHENRRNQVTRCLKVAREICQAEYGSTVITPEFWQSYFTECSEDPFKSGRQTPGKGHENWTPSFEYLTRAAVMLEVFDKSGAGEAAA